MPTEDCELVKLLKEREELEAALWVAHDALYGTLTTRQCALLLRYKETWDRRLANAKEIAVVEIIHSMQIQAAAKKPAITDQEVHGAT